METGPCGVSHPGFASGGLLPAVSIPRRMEYDRVLMPVELRWYNPTLQAEETMVATGMAPEDQWIAKSLNISVAQ